MPSISLLVEGDLDEAVAHRLVELAGGDAGTTFGKQGAAYIRQKITGFARSSAAMPLVALVDLMDTGLPCAPRVLEQWLPHPTPTTLFRVVVPEIESWVMADRNGLADHLGFRTNSVPAHPDELDDPKRTLIGLAATSRRREIREGIVPSLASASTGPRYNSILIEFVRDKWDPGSASQASPSLARATAAFSGFVRSL